MGRRLHFDKLNGIWIDGVNVGLHIRIALPKSKSRYKFCDYNFFFTENTRAYISDTHGAALVTLSNGKFFNDITLSIFKSRKPYDWFRNRKLCLVSAPVNLFGFSHSLCCLLSKFDLTVVQADIPHLISRDLHILFETKLKLFKSKLDHIDQHFRGLKTSKTQSKKLLAALFFMVDCVQRFPISKTETTESIIKFLYDKITILFEEAYPSDHKKYFSRPLEPKADLIGALTYFKSKNPKKFAFLKEDATENCIKWNEKFLGDLKSIDILFNSFEMNISPIY